MNVRLSLPVVICLVIAWITSGLLMKTVEINQHQQGRAIRRRQGIDRADGHQRIIAARIGRLITALTGNLQPAVDIPGCQTPILGAAHLGDLRQGVFMLVRLDPQPR